MGPRYYDVDGSPLDMGEWAELFEARSDNPEGEWRIGETTVGGARISTVWMGIDHNFWGEGPPLIFETMVFGGPLALSCERYATKQEAREGHARWVATVDQAAMKVTR